MGLPQFSVKRPITTIMVFCAVMLVGFFSWSKLPQELFPPINYPNLTVVTTYENAAPEEIETQITKVIEESIGTVSKLRRISSISKEGLSIVIAEFLWGTNMDLAAFGVREKIDLIKERLPLEAEEPIVKKFNPFDLPIVTLSVTAPDEHPARLRSIARRYIEDELEKIDGVASASVSGGIEREILVEINQDRLQASGLPIMDVVNSIADANINYPAGTIKEEFTEYLIRTLGEFKEVSEIENIAVGKEEFEENQIFPQYSKKEIPTRSEEKFRPEEKLILLRDIATVSDIFKEKSSVSRYNGQENISVAIQEQAVANTLAVTDKIKARLKELRQSLPRGVKSDIVSDQSIFIKNAINGVLSAALFGGILAFFILLVFLKSLRSSIVVAVSIPISVMATFFLMQLWNISLNVISLSGLALGIGMLVDNAIVVIENIFRHRGKMDIKSAASTGASEVSGAIFASTLTTIAIFVPLVLFAVGVLKPISQHLAFTIIFSLMASFIVAVTLIPVLSVGGRNKKISASGTMPTMPGARLYDKLLRKVLTFKFLSLVLVLVIFLVSISLFNVMDRELMPKMDQGTFHINIVLPTGTLLKVTDRISGKIEKILIDMEEVKDVTVTAGSTKEKRGEEALEMLGPHQARVIVNLRKGRTISTAEFIQKLKSQLNDVDLERAELEYVVQEGLLQSAFLVSAPVAAEIKGKELGFLRKFTKKVKRDIATVEGVYGVKDSLIPPSPETRVNIIKDKAATYGLSVSDIAQTAHVAIKGYIVTKFKELGKEIDVKVRLRPDDRKDLSKLRRLFIHSPLGLDLPLAEVAYFSVGKGPSEIKRLDQERATIVTANIYKRGLNRVIEDVQRIFDSYELPEGYSVRLGGESQHMQESFKSLMLAMVIAALLVYMIMAAIFESLWQPFIIMFTVPLSLIGVAWALFITGTTLNIMALLGIIMLVGIVVNNGIVLIDYVNQLRAKRVALLDSVILASRTRLRPILMTTLTTVFGLLPMALAIGEGSELWSPFAITVMGGLLASTFLTLVVIPSIYVASQNFLDKLKRMF